MTRRNDSVDRYYKWDKEEKEAASEAIIEMGRTTIREQMRVEKHERKTIKHGKRDQLEAAKADLFADLDEVNENDQRLLGEGRELERQREEKLNNLAMASDLNDAEATKARY